MNGPRVSVVVPTYNSSSSVGRTISSVLHQTLRDFELLIINDGSTDDFAGAVAPYIDDPRVRIVHQSNRGLAGARNRGISEARAALIAPIDADDLWHPEYLAELVSALECTPDAPFAFAYSFRMNEEDFLFPYIVPKSPPRHDFLGLLSLNSVGCGSAAVFRRPLMLQVGCYDENMGRKGVHGAEDWMMILRLARLGQPLLIERHLVGYRLMEAGMSRHDPKRQFRAVLAVIEHVRREMPDVPRQTLADARTMITAWLLPAFFQRREFLFFVAQALRAYALNPLWFANPLVRRAHLNRARIALKAVYSLIDARAARRPHLSEALFEGRRVFAYLQKPSSAV